MDENTPRSSSSSSSTETPPAVEDSPDRAEVASVTIPDYSALPPARPSPTPMGVVAVVAVKIVGLYCLVQALPFLYLIPADAILLFRGPSFGAIDIIVNLLDPTLYLVAGILIIRRANWIATRVLGFEEPTAEEVRPRAPGRRLQAIAFSVLGVWFVIGGLTEAVRLFVQARTYAEYSDSDVIQSVFDEPAPLVAAGVQLALGLCLFFGSRQLASFWHRFRMRAGPARVD